MTKYTQFRFQSNSNSLSQSSTMTQGLKCAPHRPTDELLYNSALHKIINRLIKF